jgi:hypothetical protein
MQECVKIKVKLSLCLTKHHAMKTYWGMEVWLHAFLTSGDRRIDGPHSKSGRGGEEKNSSPLPGIEPRSSSL